MSWNLQPVDAVDTHGGAACTRWAPVTSRQSLHPHTRPVYLCIRNFPSRAAQRNEEMTR